MTASNELPDELKDAEFRAEMAALRVTPLQDGTAEVRADDASKPKAKTPRAKTKVVRRDMPTASGAGVMIDKTNQGEYAEFARGGVQKRNLRHLKRGEYDFTETLDLHGNTTAAAEKLLDDFIATADNPTVLIIHGKGLHSHDGRGAVLKHFTQTFLKQHSAVRAFCSALPKDGGTGALYVLLTRR